MGRANGVSATVISSQDITVESSLVYICFLEEEKITGE